MPPLTLPRGMPGFTSSSSQVSAPVFEFRCLYSQQSRKHKTWQDGILSFHTFNRRILVHDEEGNKIGETYWNQGRDFNEGGELRLENGVSVQVGEKKGQKEQNLSPILERKKPSQAQRQSLLRPGSLPRLSPMVEWKKDFSMHRLPQPRPSNVVSQGSREQVDHDVSLQHSEDDVDKSHLMSSLTEDTPRKRRRLERDDNAPLRTLSNGVGKNIKEREEIPQRGLETFCSAKMTLPQHHTLNGWKSNAKPMERFVTDNKSVQNTPKRQTVAPLLHTRPLGQAHQNCPRASTSTRTKDSHIDIVDDIIDTDQHDSSPDARQPKVCNREITSKTTSPQQLETDRPRDGMKERRINPLTVNHKKRKTLMYRDLLPSHSASDVNASASLAKASMSRPSEENKMSRPMTKPGEPDRSQQDRLGGLERESKQRKSPVVIKEFPHSQASWSLPKLKMPKLNINNVSEPKQEQDQESVLHKPTNNVEPRNLDLPMQVAEQTAGDDDKNNELSLDSGPWSREAFDLFGRPPPGREQVWKYGNAN